MNQLDREKAFQERLDKRMLDIERQEEEEKAKMADRLRQAYMNRTGRKEMKP